MIVCSMFSMAICISLLIIGVCTMFYVGYNAAVRCQNKESATVALPSIRNHSKTTLKGSCSRTKKILDTIKTKVWLLFDKIYVVLDANGKLESQSNNIYIKNKLSDLSTVIQNHQIEGKHNTTELKNVEHVDSTVEINWELLKHEDKHAYNERKEIVEKRIHETIPGDIVSIPGNGNCMINAYLYHVGKMTVENALKEREKMISFMIVNKNEYPLIVNEIAYLDEMHLKALHEMNKINILVFEYQTSTDSISRNYYYNPEYTSNKCLCLVYYRHTQHYNYCIINKDYIFPPQCGYYYHQSGSKHWELEKFDHALVYNVWPNALHLIDTTQKSVLRESKTFVRSRNAKNRFIIKQIELKENKTEETTGMYSYGYHFAYGFEGENIYEDSIKIYPKYSSLKEELMSANPGINFKMFNNEYKNAVIHWASWLRKQKYPNLSHEELFALMIHCNCDCLQHQLGLSMRENEGNNHNEFYHFAKCLKIAVHQHGSRTYTKVFYHGIDKQLIFPSYVNNIQINCTLSMTTSWEVAVNFSGDSGLVIEFGDDFVTTNVLMLHGSLIILQKKNVCLWSLNFL
eukprot:455492_1